MRTEQKWNKFAVFSSKSPNPMYLHVTGFVLVHTFFFESHSSWWWNIENASIQENSIVRKNNFVLLNAVLLQHKCVYANLRLTFCIAIIFSHMSLILYAIPTIWCIVANAMNIMAVSHETLIFSIVNCRIGKCLLNFEEIACIHKCNTV